MDMDTENVYLWRFLLHIDIIYACTHVVPRLFVLIVVNGTAI